MLDILNNDDVAASKAEEVEENEEELALAPKVKEVLAAQKEKELLQYGMPLSELLSAYLKGFTQRKDIVVTKDLSGKRAQNSLLLEHSAIPVALLNFYSEIGSLSFSWKPKKKYSFGLDSYVAPNIGQVAFEGLDKLSWKSSNLYLLRQSFPS